MNRPRSLPTILSVLLLLLAGLAVGCGDDDEGGGGGGGGGGKPSDGAAAVAQAADKADEQGSASFTIEGSVSAAGQDIDLKGEGEFDFKKQLGNQTISTEVPGQGEIEIEQVIDKRVFYMRSEALSGQLPGGKEWIKFDLDEAGKQQGVDFSQLQQGQSNDPSQILEYLKGAGSVKEVGEEEIDGVQTTHYKATVDFGKVIDKADPEARKGLQDFAEKAGIDEIPTEVWIDEDGLVRRQKIAYEVEAQGQKVSTDMTINYKDYGQKVEVEIPPASETTDLADLGGLGG